MISRIADHCFWLGRYLERAEATARLLAATTELSRNSEFPAHLCWRPLIVLAGEERQFRGRQIDDASSDTGDGNTGVPSPVDDNDSTVPHLIPLASLQALVPLISTQPSADWPSFIDGERVQRVMTWDEDNRISLRRSISCAHVRARAIADLVSHEVWEVVSELHLWMSGTAAMENFTRDRAHFYRHIWRTTQLALGLLRSTTLHSEPLNFIWLGMLLERSRQTARTLDAYHYVFSSDELRSSHDPMTSTHEVVETSLWITLLYTLAGCKPLVKRPHESLTAARAANFLVDEQLFPRSISYCVSAAYERLRRLQPNSTESLRRLSGLHLDLQARAADGPLRAVDNPTLFAHVVVQIDRVCADLSVELIGNNG